MKVYTKEEWINAVPERWAAQYAKYYKERGHRFLSSGKQTDEVYQELYQAREREGFLTAEMVEKIIGNSSWGYFACSHCKKYDPDRLAFVGHDFGEEEAEYRLLCGHCLLKTVNELVVEEDMVPRSKF